MKHTKKNLEIDIESAQLKRLDYDASNGHEIFLSFIEPKHDLLFAFLRLRAPTNPFRKELIDSALIRELHVYSKEAQIGISTTDSTQHKGLGKALLAEAEKIALEELDFKNINIISGIGAKEYYKKTGYTKSRAYMKKQLI